MTNKKIYGQFFTTNSEYIIGNLISDIPNNINIIEPFVGNGDLISDIPNNSNIEIYDIEPKIDNVIKQDTLKNSPIYLNKFVITNPPFLARNKNKDKSIYDLYKVDDLYKAFLKSIKDVEGGILIIPLNFLSDKDNNIREYFFSNFQIINMNIFEEQVFDDTSYTVISFSFKKFKNNNEIINIKTLLFPSNNIINISLNKKYGYRICDKFNDIISNVKNIGIKRLLVDKPQNSKIFLRAIDTGSLDGRISLSIQDEFYGNTTDRTFATLVLDKEYSIEIQEKICLLFNELIENFRKEYNSLFLTNFRNSTSLYARKRIGFDDVYKIVSYIIIENIK